MFGYIIINKGDMKFKEFDVYHSYYCGLCDALKHKYGKIGQLSLSYDMTFVVMLLSSLYEPETKLGQVKCAAHPFEKHTIRCNEFSGYGADMNILFTYYKCRDDWEDDRKLSRLAYSRLLSRAYRSVCVRYGEKAKRIARLMREMEQEEKRQSQDIDHMAGLFGEIMGEILAVRDHPSPQVPLNRQHRHPSHPARWTSPVRMKSSHPTPSRDSPSAEAVPRK